MRQARGISAALIGLGLAVALAGCSTDGPSLPTMASFNNLFKEKKPPLPGTRVAVLSGEEELAAETGSTSAVALPPPVQNADWTQPGGPATNSPGHLALEGSLRTVWSADAGTGSSSSGKLTASPIVSGGRVYVLDAEGRVSAFNLAGGSRVWSTSLAPETENDSEGFGGGLAADGDRILAGTGFGTAVALDARTGSKLWEKSLGAPVRTSPTAADGRMYVTTIEGKLYCLSIADGAEQWTFRGTPPVSSLLNNSSPAVADGLVVAPYPTGEIVAVSVESGEMSWTESVGSTRAGSSMAALSDPSRPVIDNGVVYAAGHSGNLIATSEKSGERIWSLALRSIQTPWVAGDTLYAVDSGGKLVAVRRETGQIAWSTKLAGGGPWHGPVLAGNRLWLVSSGGKLVGVDALTGKVGSQRDLGDRVMIRPIVADGRMLVLMDDATLVALN